MRCLLVASIFAPINGGSAVVYETLCRFAPEGSMVVYAPWRHYIDGNEISGWRDHDRAAPYTVYRTELIRPQMLPPPPTRLHSVWRMLSIDIPLKFRVFLEIRKIVRKHGINVVCIGELTSGSWIGIAAQRFLGCRMINYVHGEEITTETEYRFFGRQRRRYLHRTDAIVAVSRFTQDALIRLMGVPKEKIRLIHNGVNTERFTPGPKPDFLLARHELHGKRIILSVGRVVPRKGMDVLIRAMPLVLSTTPDAHLLIVGEGEFRSILEQLTDELGLRAHVTFAGRVADTELADYYRLSDIFAMPNREMPDGDTEGFGLVFLEANACRKAVVGGRAGGAVEAVRDGENGLLADGWSVPDVADALTRLLTDSELQKRIEARGLEIALASSSRAKAEQFYDLCMELAKK
tara:strand:+ start:4968 stop:6185 length:1218 start_codon:yes stop_codon:yes gene_type:complete